MINLDDALYGWTIYDRPSDYPAHWAVRMWIVVGDGLVHQRPFAILCESLEEARQQIPAGLVCFPREPEDDPVIVESWL